MTNGFFHHVGGGLAEMVGLGSQVAGETKKQEIEGILGSVLNDIGMTVQTFVPGIGKVIGSGFMAAGSGLLVAQIRSEHSLGLISRSQMLAQETLYGAQFLGNIFAGGLFTKSIVELEGFKISLFGKSIVDFKGLKTSLSKMESDLTTNMSRNEQISNIMSDIIEGKNHVIRDTTPIFVKQTFHFPEIQGEGIKVAAQDIQLTYTASQKSENAIQRLLGPETITSEEINQLSTDTGLEKPSILKLFSQKPTRGELHYTSPDGAGESLNAKALNTLYKNKLQLFEEESSLRTDIYQNKMDSDFVQNRFNLYSKVALGANIVLDAGNYTTYAVSQNDVS